MNRLGFLAECGTGASSHCREGASPRLESAKPVA